MSRRYAPPVGWPALSDAPSAIVVGAGVFGASVARQLCRRGWRVSLVEQYSPGDVRASSGGESRLLRYSHGNDDWYTDSAWRARRGWRELGEAVGAELLVECGVAWFAAREDGWEAASETRLVAAGIPVKRLSPSEGQRLFPDLAVDDLAFVLYEPNAGVLRARDAVRALVADGRRHGLEVLPGHATPSGEAVEVNGRRLWADGVVWSCGPWLAQLFPDHVDLRVTKQDVCFFGVGRRWRTPGIPGWVDYDNAAYGVGDFHGRGFKCAPDVEGPAFDPDRDDRRLSPDNEQRARAYLRRRFPALAAAPLVGSRTCQYTLTRDTEFVVDRHPDHEHVWLVGGGSGHGFKHGPSIGRYVADLLEGAAQPDPRFRLGHRPTRPAMRTAGR